MKKNSVAFSLCLLAVLGTVGSAASAMSLGKVRGDLLIGQRLDLSVPVSLETPEPLAVSCFSVDIYHADTRITEGQISLSVESGNDPLAALLRIRSPVAINEPVVTLVVKASCGAETTRRYTLLPDVPAPNVPLVEAAPPQPVASAAAAPAPPANTSKAMDNGRAATPTATTPAAKRKPASAARNRPPAPPKVVAAAGQPSAPASTLPPPAKAPASPAPAQAGRLKLDLIDAAPSAGRASAASGVATTLAAAPTALDKDVEVTRSLNEVIADEARLRALEAKIQSLVELNASNQAAVAAMKTRLEQAEGERYNNPLVYALGLALLLGGAAFVVQRRRQALDQRHWAGENTTFGLTNFPSSFLNAETAVSDLPEQPDTTKTGPNSKPPPAPPASGTLPPAVPPLSKAAVASPAARAVDVPDFFLNSVSSTLHSVSTEELFDIQRQADFFVVLGQHDKAIDLLIDHIEKNPDTSPLAYLDLLAIYHQQANRTLFERLREDIRKNFRVQIPAFDQFTEQGRSLVDYPDTLAQITRAWPRPEVLALIEELVFSDPFQPQRDMFEVEAYRDLMLLFAVARGLLTGVVSEPLRQPGMPAGSPAAPLDIDLSDQLKLLDNEPSKRPPA